jgi:SAM-dependent methyltransferase
MARRDRDPPGNGWAVKPEDIAAGYDTLAAHWDSERFPRDNGIEQHKRALQFADKPGPALDMGCGSSGRFIDLLTDAGYQVEGLDLSREMLTRAKIRHPEVTFHHGDIRHWVPEQSYHFISAWDCLWHLPLADQAPTLVKILQMLSPQGIFIFSMGGLSAPAEHENSVMGPAMYYSTLGIPKTLDIISHNNCLCRHLEFDQYPEVHVYLIVERIAEL